MEIISKIYLSSLDCLLWDVMASNVVEHCEKGDIISVRGRLQSRIVETEEEKRYVLDVIGEKITFISSYNKRDQEKLEENKENNKENNKKNKEDSTK